MSKLTNSEAKWVRTVQSALDKCPSDRLGFYTIGDHQIYIYDKEKQELIDRNKFDLCVAVAECSAHLGELEFPNSVESTAG